MLKQYNGSNIKDITVNLGQTPSILAHLKNGEIIKLCEVKKSAEKYAITSILPVTENVLKKVINKRYEFKAFLYNVYHDRKNLYNEALKFGITEEEIDENVKISCVDAQTRSKMYRDYDLAEYIKEKIDINEILEILDAYLDNYDKIYIPKSEIVDVKISKAIIGEEKQYRISTILENGEEKVVTTITNKDDVSKVDTLKMLHKDAKIIDVIMLRKIIDMETSEYVISGLIVLYASAVSLIKIDYKNYSFIDKLVINKEAIARYFKTTKQIIKK